MWNDRFPTGVYHRPGYFDFWALTSERMIELATGRFLGTIILPSYQPIYFICEE